MLTRLLLAGLLASVLASCALSPPSVLAPVRDGSHSGRPDGRPEPAREPGTTSAGPAAAASARPAPTGAPLASDAADAPSPRRRGDARASAREQREGPAFAPPPDPGRPLRPESSPVAALVASAREAGEAGRHGRAAAALERALKVEPRNPRLWHRLALVRFRQGRHAEAGALALRSNSLATGDPDLESRNWRLIAAARQRMGDESGAREALGRARAR